MIGASIVTKVLSDAGVTTIFSLSGNQIMPIYNACLDDKIELVHVRHEAAASFMAEAYAQLTGEIGVALITAAPGFTNGLEPLYNAQKSETPLILISGDAPVELDGMGAFQELNQTAISSELTKASIRATKVETIGQDVARAIRIATSGRPGPVHLALPFDVLNASTQGFDAAQLNIAPEITLPVESDIAAVADAIKAAERPFIIVGPASNASRTGDLHSRLADSLDAPVICMESPRGFVDPSLGGFSKSFAKADLVVSLGKTIDFTLNFGKVLSDDNVPNWMVIDPQSDMLERARRNLGPQLAATLRADVAASADRLIDLARRPQASRKAWREEVSADIAQRNYETKIDSSAEYMSAAVACAAVQRQIDAAEEPVLIADGGEFGQWAQACLSSPSRVINGPSGAIGAALCYGGGAKKARPNATIFSVMGDGTVGFHFAEFETAVRNNTPFIVVIGHDSRWNAEHQIQMREYGPDRLNSCGLNWTRYDLAVEALGGHGEWVSDPADLDAALDRAVQSGLPACVCIQIEGLPAPGGVAHQ